MLSIHQAAERPSHTTEDAVQRLLRADLAGMVATYGVDAWDAHGEYIDGSHREDVSRSLLRNWSRFMRTMLGDFTAGTLTFTDTVPTVRAFNKPSTNSGSGSMIGGAALAGIGTGSTAVAPTDTNYVAFVGEIAVDETIVSEPSTGAQTWRTYGNVTVASATAVAEIGLRQSWKVATIGYTTMFARDVITVVNVPAGGTIQVRYDWTITP